MGDLRAPEERVGCGGDEVRESVAQDVEVCMMYACRLSRCCVMQAMLDGCERAETQEHERIGRIGRDRRYGTGRRRCCDSPTIDLTRGLASDDGAAIPGETRAFCFYECNQSWAGTDVCGLMSRRGYKHNVSKHSTQTVVIHCRRDRKGSQAHSCYDPIPCVVDFVKGLEFQTLRTRYLC